jgi:hypothetical protein
MNPTQLANALARYEDRGNGALKRVRAFLSLGGMPPQTVLIDALKELDDIGTTESDNEKSDKLAILSCALCGYLT